MFQIDTWHGAGGLHYSATAVPFHDVVTDVLPASPIKASEATIFHSEITSAWRSTRMESTTSFGEKALVFTIPAVPGGRAIRDELSDGVLPKRYAGVASMQSAIYPPNATRSADADHDRQYDVGGVIARRRPERHSFRKHIV